jgi:FAD dependent oxidoreductase.
MASTQNSFTARVLEGAAALASTAWPVMARLLPERLEFDDTQSIWHAGTPEYQSRAPLSGSITADLAIIGGGFTGVSTAYHVAQRFRIGASSCSKRHRWRMAPVDGTAVWR